MVSEVLWQCFCRVTCFQFVHYATFGHTIVVAQLSVVDFPGPHPDLLKCITDVVPLNCVGLF